MEPADHIQTGFNLHNESIVDSLEILEADIVFNDSKRTCCDLIGATTACARIHKLT